jgi:recombination protein RecT
MSDLSRQVQQQQTANGQAVDRAGEMTRKAYGARTEIAKALGDRIGPDRFLRALATELRTTEHLDECTDESVLGGLFVAAQLGLEVGRERGLVYLVPRRNKRNGNRYEATLQIGYKGWIELFYRAGARTVSWFLVREGDTFRIGSDSRVGKTYEWIQADPNSTRPVTGAVAQVVTPSGGVVWEYMSRADIEKRSTGTNFWGDWWDEMALKTVLHRLAATAPASTELVLAQRADETTQLQIPGETQPVAQHLPLVATPAPRPTPRPQAATAPPAARTATEPRPADDRPAAGDEAPPRDTGEVTEEEWAEIERQQYAEEIARLADDEDA